jgi:Flp pilus assembly protein TadB
LNLSVIFPNKKVGLLKKLQLKVLQNRLKHLSKKADEGTQSKLNVLSIISLALGMIGVIVFFSFYSPIAFIASLAALITGIIALGKRRNNSKGSRAMAIIGTILGGGLILFVLVALIAWSGGW